MTINEFIRKQKFSKNTETTKLNLLKSVSDFLISPKKDNFKTVIKYLSILANTYHIDLINSKSQTIKTNKNELLNNIGKLIQNKSGYMNILPETYKMIVSYAKSLKIEFSF